MSERSNPNPAETEAERVVRNWNEILQELRVTQTGGQIFLGFLLTLAFQPRLAEIDLFGRAVYLTLVITAIVSMVASLAPVSVHRMLFRRKAKPALVRFGNRMIKVTLALVSVVLVGTVLLVFDIMIDRAIAIVAGVVTALLIVVMWLLVPIAVHRGSIRIDRVEN